MFALLIISDVWNMIGDFFQELGHLSSELTFDELEHGFSSVAQVIALITEAAGVMIIAIAVLQSTFKYLISMTKSRARGHFAEGIKVNLGRALDLSLQFLLGGDILKTAISPSWEAIGKLAAIAIIRTALNYFLQKEMGRELHMVEEAIHEGVGNKKQLETLERDIMGLEKEDEGVAVK